MGKALKIMAYTFLAVLVLFSGLGIYQGSTVLAAANSIQLTIDHTRLTKTAPTNGNIVNPVIGNLTNFPIMIHLGTSSGLNGADTSGIFSALGNNYLKLSVTLSDRVTQLPVEVVRWDSASKQAVLWTKVPSVSMNSDTILYLNYDSTAADNTAYVGLTRTAPAESVWDSNYVGVWHLSENGKSGQAFKDSTSYHHDGTGGGALLSSGGSTGVSPTQGIGGPTGVYQSYAGGGSKNWIAVPTLSNYAWSVAQNLNTGLTVTVVALDKDITHSWSSYEYNGIPIVQYGNWGGDGEQWQLVPEASNGGRNSWVVGYIYGTNGGLGNGSDARATSGYPTPYWANGEWTSFGMLIDAPGNGHKGHNIYSIWEGVVYRSNGCEGIDTRVANDYGAYVTLGTPVTNVRSPLSIGTSYDHSGSPWYGNITELHISKVQRSDSWIAAEYYSAMDQMISYGSAPAPPPSSTPPSVTTAGASGITTSGATLNGNLSSLGSAFSVSVSFQYGTSTSYGSTTSTQSRSSTGTFTAPISGLNPGTTYHFRSVASGSSTTYGADQTFTTTSAGTNPPPPPPSSSSSTFGLNSGDAVYTSSFLNAQRFQNTAGSGTLSKLEVLVNDSSASANLRLGVYADNNGSPGNLLLDAGSVQASNGWVGISNLNLPVSSGAYYWLAFLPQSPTGIAYRSSGMPSNCHDDFAYTFGSLPTTSIIGEVNSTPFVMRATVSASTPTTMPPSVATNAASGITTSGAILNGNLSSLGSASSVSVSFQYGTSTSYGSTTATQARSSTGAFTATRSSLASGTTYHYRAVATANGVTVYGDDQTFTTSSNR